MDLGSQWTRVVEGQKYRPVANGWLVTRDELDEPDCLRCPTYKLRVSAWVWVILTALNLALAVRLLSQTRVGMIPNAYETSFVTNVPRNRVSIAMPICVFLAIPAFLVLFPKVTTMTKARQDEQRWTMTQHMANGFVRESSKQGAIFRKWQCADDQPALGVRGTLERKDTSSPWYHLGRVALCVSEQSCSGAVGGCPLREAGLQCELPNYCSPLYGSATADLRHAVVS